MTAYQQPGPATQRIDHLIQFFRERNLSLTLLTRKSSLSQNAADSQTALSWRDFQQIITNARQVLPAHEFDQAAATFCSSRCTVTGLTLHAFSAALLAS